MNTLMNWRRLKIEERNGRQLALIPVTLLLIALFITACTGTTGQVVGDEATSTAPSSVTEPPSTETLPQTGDVEEGTLYDAAREEPPLTIYTDQTVDVIDALIEAFRQQYPEIEVDYWRGDSSELTQRIETEFLADRVVADLFTTTERRAAHLDEVSAVEYYQSPLVANYLEAYHDPEERWQVWSISLASFAWNTDLVSEEEAPKDWDDLLDPKWRGKLGMQDPLEGGGAAAWVATMYVAWGEEKWEDYMTTLGQEMDITYGPYLEMQERLAAGDFLVQVAAYPNFIQPMVEDGAPVDWGVPDPIYFTGLVVALTKGGDSPNSAKLLVDWLLSDEAQTLIGELGLVPALAESMPEPYRSRLANANFIAAQGELEAERADFFEQKREEFFGNR